MNKEQKMWFKKLKKCLVNMPRDTEISVCVVAGSTSCVNLHELGDIGRLEHSDYDRMQPDVSYGEIALDSFRVGNVIANSECI